MRKLMWLSIGFAGGCALGVYLLPNNWIIPLLLVLGLTSALLGWKGIFRISLLSLGCAAGLLWFLVFQRVYLLPAMELDGVTVNAAVTATDYSYETTYGTAVDGKVTLEGKTYQIRVYLNEKMEIQPGDSISGEFKMRYTAPGGEEDATYHAGKRIFLLGYQRGYAKLIRYMGSETEYYAAVLRGRIKDILRAAFPEDIFPFTQALLLGDGTELDYEIDTAFKISGIRHIIAVSGLHVTILYTLLSAVTLRRPILTALLSTPVLFVFAAVAGFTPSVTRACIMVGLMILAQVFNREYDSPTALGFAVLVMLVINPLTITSIGFQLSVGCVAGILLFQQPINGWVKGKFGKVNGKTLKGRLLHWFSSSVSVTLSAMSLTTPLAAYYFGTVSIIGVVTNLLTLWVVNLIFNGLVNVCLLSLISASAAAALGWLLAWPIRFVLSAAKVLSGIPLAAVYTESPYIAAWLIFVYLLMAVFLLQYKKRPGILVCCAALGLCAALLASWMEPLRDDLRVTVLDVGQGQCVLLQSEGRTYMVDCGGDSDDEAADIAAETLLSQGIFRLDGIILTHADRDHGGGMVNLLTRVQADLLVMPAHTDPEAAEDITNAVDGKVLLLEENLLVTYGETKMTVFAPTYVSESNENSLCVLFTAENCDILITGDRGSFGERMLLQDAQLPQVEVLLVGHHGSKYSTSEELLDAVQPEVAIISVGADNSYGHPAQEVLDRLAQFGCRVYRTDENGTIIYRR